MDTNHEKRSLVDLLNEIVLAIRAVNDDIGLLTKEDFRNDGKSQRAVVHSLRVVSEAAAAAMPLDPDLESRSPEVWEAMQGVRDMRSHLERVNSDVVWDVAKIMLPRLDAAIFWLLAEKVRFACAAKREQGNRSTPL